MSVGCVRVAEKASVTSTEPLKGNEIQNWPGDTPGVTSCRQPQEVWETSS